MIAIVKIALSRPYTFVVSAILILIFGVLSAIRTPTRHSAEYWHTCGGSGLVL